MTDPCGPTPRRARLAQERSREKRQALLDATLELFLENGRQGVTHRAVAQRADVSVATIGYYFAHVDELVHTAISETLTRWTDGFRALAGVEGADLATVLRSLRGLLGDSPQPERVAAWQLYVSAMADPTLAPYVTHLVDVVQEALTAAYAGTGVDEEVPLLTMIAISGASMTVTARGGSADDIVAALTAAMSRFVDPAGPAGLALRESFEALDHR